LPLIVARCAVEWHRTDYAAHMRGALVHLGREVGGSWPRLEPETAEVVAAIGVRHVPEHRAQRSPAREGRQHARRIVDVKQFVRTRVEERECRGPRRPQDGQRCGALVFGRRPCIPFERKLVAAEAFDDADVGRVDAGTSQFVAEIGQRRCFVEALSAPSPCVEVERPRHERVVPRHADAGFDVCVDPSIRSCRVHGVRQ